MTQKIVARQDPELTARVLCSGPLLYSERPDETLDQPAHVRAASGLARIGGRLTVFQDDANFIALINPADNEVRAVVLPAGEGGRRQFDDARGNKHLKLDLEACLTIPDASSGGELLVAFGSGSKPRRERVVVISGWHTRDLQIQLYHAAELYRVLHERADFAGSDLNVEGAIYLDGKIRLFGRGNGKARHGLLPLDATCDLDWRELYLHLQDPRATPPPQPHDVVQYDLGSIGGVRLGFTDAAVAPHGRVAYAATAELSPDATLDGPVAGSVIGIIDPAEGARWTQLLDEEGRPFTGKAEGLLLASETPSRAYVVIDQDNPMLPSLLCEVLLTGTWY